MRSPNQSYLPAIDHLRGVAALWIIFYHGFMLFSHHEIYGGLFTLEHWPQGVSWWLVPFVEGHTAVALFMVLSGFIFTYGSYGRHIEFSGFLLNRFLRTYPMFLLLIGIGIFSYPENFSVSGLLRTMFGLANLPGALNLNTFSSMFWAVAVEWQFYVVFPLFLILLNNRGKRSLLGLLLLFVGIRTALVFWGGADPRDLSYWTIAGRIDQFLIGMLVAVLYRQWHSRPIPGWLFPLSLLLLYLLLAGFHWLGSWPSRSVWRVLWPLFEGLVWGGVVLCYMNFAQKLPAWLSSFLVFFGSISYSLYLLHYPLIVALLDWTPGLPFELAPAANALGKTLLIALPLVTVLAMLTYKFVEKPFLNLRVRYQEPVRETVPLHTRRM